MLVRPTTTANRVVPCRPERPIAVVQQHRDVVGIEVRHRQVVAPITIEVAHGDGRRTISGAIICGWHGGGNR